jgi:hypothetical protein
MVQTRSLNARKWMVYNDRIPRRRRDVDKADETGYNHPMDYVEVDGRIGKCGQKAMRLRRQP